MKLTFIPAPGSPYRVTSADDPQPEQSWSPQASSKRVVASTTQADVPPAAVEHAASALPAAPPPGPSATNPPPDSSQAGTAAPDFLPPLPPGSCPHCPDRPLLFQARQQANFYRAMFQAAKQREATKAARITELEAEVRILKQRLYGSRSEQRHGADQPGTSPAQDPLAEDASPAEAATPGSTAAAKPRRKRGQQKGNPIPKRRDYSHLPVLTEERVLPDEEACCSCCGKPFSPGGWEEDKEIIEVEVKAYRRRIRRRRYLRTCSCRHRSWAQSNGMTTQVQWRREDVRAQVPEPGCPPAFVSLSLEPARLSAQALFAVACRPATFAVWHFPACVGLACV